MPLVGGISIRSKLERYPRQLGTHTKNTQKKGVRKAGLSTAVALIFSANLSTQQILLLSESV
jgi:hypothetical protein